MKSTAFSGLVFLAAVLPFVSSSPNNETSLNTTKSILESGGDHLEFPNSVVTRRMKIPYGVFRNILNTIAMKEREQDGSLQRSVRQNSQNISRTVKRLELIGFKFQPEKTNVVVTVPNLRVKKESYLNASECGTAKNFLAGNEALFEDKEKGTRKRNEKRTVVGCAGELLKIAIFAFREFFTTFGTNSSQPSLDKGHPTTKVPKVNTTSPTGTVPPSLPVNETSIKNLTGSVQNETSANLTESQSGLLRLEMLLKGDNITNNSSQTNSTSTGDAVDDADSQWELEHNAELDDDQEARRKRMMAQGWMRLMERYDQEGKDYDSLEDATNTNVTSRNASEPN